MSSAQYVIIAANAGAGYGLGKLAGQLVPSLPGGELVPIGAAAALAYWGPNMKNDQALIAAGAAAYGYVVPMASLGQLGTAAAYGAAGYWGIPYIVSKMAS